MILYRQGGRGVLKSWPYKGLVAVPFACWEAGLMLRLQEGHSGVCFLIYFVYIFAPGKVTPKYFESVFVATYSLWPWRK